MRDRLARLMAGSGDLVIVAGLALVSALLANLPGEGSLFRMALAAPLVLVLPGYALVTATFPPRTLGTPERLALSIGASIALAVLGAFVLNWLPWGLQTATWTVLLAGLTLLASAVAHSCRRKLPAMFVPKSHTPKSPANWRPVQLRLRDGALLLVAVALVVWAASLSREGAAQQHQAGFTQLWALPGDSATQEVRLGIQCEESTPVTYLLRVEMGGQVLQEWSPLELQPGERWEADGVVLPAADASGTTPVQAVLYRLDQPDIAYRRVTVWQ
jgi:uncharacterized membrane protein